MENKFKTLKIIDTNKEPIILNKEDKHIAVSIELINGKYTVGFDIINQEDIYNFDMQVHDYETIAVIDCFNQKGGYIDCRNELIQRFDEVTIEEFKQKYF